MDGNWQYWLYRGFQISMASVLAKSCKIPIWIIVCLLVSVKLYKTISAVSLCFCFQPSKLTSTHFAKRNLIIALCSLFAGFNPFGSKPGHSTPNY